jgi:hypothetical protein
MKHRILSINISLFVTLFGLIAGIDVQAYDRIELAGDVLVFALPNSFKKLYKIKIIHAASFTTIRLNTMAWECLWDSDSGHCL